MFDAVVFYIYAMFHGARHESYCHFDYNHFHIHGGWQNIPGERAQMCFGMLGSFVFDGEWRGFTFYELTPTKTPYCLIALFVRVKWNLFFGHPEQLECINAKMINCTG